jgi:hypothetical protein
MRTLSLRPIQRPIVLSLVLGCVLAVTVLPACGGGGGGAPCHTDIGVGFKSTTGLTIDYQYISMCGACTPDGPAAGTPGATCTTSDECRSLCCTCPDSVRKTQACINGLCATQAQACTDTPNVCNNFDSP